MQVVIDCHVRTCRHRYLFEETPEVDPVCPKCKATLEQVQVGIVMDIESDEVIEFRDVQIAGEGRRIPYVGPRTETRAADVRVVNPQDPIDPEPITVWVGGRQYVPADAAPGPVGESYQAALRDLFETLAWWEVRAEGTLIGKLYGAVLRIAEAMLKARGCPDIEYDRPGKETP